MKKNFLMAATFALVLSACSKNETFETPNTVNAIGFVNLNDKVTSRSANDAGDDFGVYAVYKDGTTYGSDWFMANTTVDGTAYTYAPLKFWPAAGTIDFYGYAPASSGQLDLTNVVYGTGDNATFEAQYSVANAAQEDFTVSTPVLALNHKGQTQLVELLFAHALSQVKFEVAFDGTTLDNTHYTLTVKDVSLDVPYDQNTIRLDTKAWGTNFAKTAGYAPYTGATNTGHYTILPQTLSAVNKATVSFDLRIEDKVTGEVYLNGKLKSIELDGTTAAFAGFEAGKSYLFKIKIAATDKDDKDQPIFDPIAFSATLSPWADSNVSIN